MLDTVWNLVWFMLSIFLMVTYFIALFTIFGDLFRSDKSGFAKAGWLIFIFVLPLLGILVYLIANGDNMQQRAVAAAQAEQRAVEAYVQDLAGVSPADQISRAKALLDAGTITEDEYAVLKAKALA